MAGPSCLVLVCNEAYFLPYVLLQTVGYFDSYVIYDVGSTDNTRAIIDWFTKKVDGQADLFVRYLPMVSKDVQGTFRNSMIVEGRRDVYFILDGDELYKPDDLSAILPAAAKLKYEHDSKLGYLNLAQKNPTPRTNPIDDSVIRFGVFKRIEMSPDLTQRYNRERSHHRLYTRDAFWTGNHPGEVSGYEQKSASEIEFDIRCWHLHNTLRSPQENDALMRMERKNKKTYHPLLAERQKHADNMSSFDLLAELPILQKPIENFPVSPALAALQARHRVI